MMYVAERVAPYKRVRGVTFVDEVPRAASGKILRRELRGRS
jgi:acyl-coenzyme A synthetase/AMP-(fatty) acid ligase